MISISENELIEALRQASLGVDAGPTDAHTVLEMQEMTGRGCGFIRKNLKVLLAQGRAEMVMVQRQAINGRMQPTSAYRIKTDGKAEAA